MPGIRQMQGFNLICQAIATDGARPAISHVFPFNNGSPITGTLLLKPVARISEHSKGGASGILC
jgi:hypothetical protein